jgi:hypothetical protein
MPPEPAATDRATIAAHLAAFGSPKARGLYQDWRSLTMATDTELDTVDFNAARQELADAIAAELGHR